MHFGINFIKQKLQGTSDLVGWVTFSGPKSRYGSSEPHVLLEIWSLTMKVSLKTNALVYVLNSYLVRLDTLYPDPGSKGG